MWRTKVISAKFELKLQDMWIGAFWKIDREITHLWICFVPCIPLHLQWTKVFVGNDIDDIPF